MKDPRAPALCILLVFNALTAAGQSPASETVTILSFNIQIFGVSKMSNPETAGILADIVSRADIAAIQEVRSLSIEPLESFMALLPETYGYVLGPREGRSRSKEQYWVIYDTAKFTVLGQETWADEDDIFERNPLGVYFKSSGSFDFILINNHIRPAGAAREIAALPALAAYYRDLWDEPDILLVGDFNADGRYYDEGLLETVFPPAEYTIVLTNEFDTTVGANDYTYDRFIISSSAREDYSGERGVMRFEELYDFSRLGIEPGDLSDHYPIWAGFWIDRDTD